MTLQAVGRHDIGARMLAFFAFRRPRLVRIDLELRSYFDAQLEQVLPQLPQLARDLLDEMPLIVEDFPSPQMLKKLGMQRRGDLCGLYTGVPINERSVQMSGVLSEAIYLFREGILNMAVDRRGRIDEQELREQIRVTILHELGHHHGLDEDDLEELGYD